jgi:Tetracyclin repressor-like, C-terminal domain
MKQVECAATLAQRSARLGADSPYSSRGSSACPIARVARDTLVVGDSGTTDADYRRAQDGTFREAANPGRYPYFAKTIHGVSDTFEIDLNALFELGLGAMLDGFTPS